MCTSEHEAMSNCRKTDDNMYTNIDCWYPYAIDKNAWLLYDMIKHTRTYVHRSRFYSIALEQPIYHGYPCRISLQVSCWPYGCQHGVA